MNSFEIMEFIIFLAASVFYIKHIIQDKEFIPNPLGFGIWMLADAIHLFTYLDFSSFWVGPVIMFSGATSIVIIGIIRTIRSSEKEKANFSWLDYVVISTVAISITILLFSHNAVWSNLAIQVTLTLGFIPIIKDLIVKKSIEPILSWTLFFAGFCVVLTQTLQEYHQWEELIYPIVGVVGDFTVLILSGYNLVIKSIS